MFDVREIQVIGASVTIVAIIVIVRRFKRSGFNNDGKHYPPSLPILPVIAEILRGGMVELPRIFMKSAQKLGPIFTLRIGTRGVHVLNGYDSIYDALVRHAEAFSNRDSVWIEEKFLNPKQRGIIFGRYDDVYKKYNKLSLTILKEFGFGVGRVMETRILQEAELLNEEILQLNGRPFDPKLPISFAFSNVILSILFGKNFFKSSPKELSTLVESGIAYFSNMDYYIDMAPFLRFLPSFRRKIDCLCNSNQRMLESIETAMKFIKSNNSEPTFVGRFLEISGTDYDHQDLLYLLRDLCLGGTETVPTTLDWAVVELANHPEIQKRCQGEIGEVVPEGRPPSLDDKPRLPYTEASILEIMRRRTSSHFTIRHTSLKETKVLEYDIPKDCQVMLNAYSAHMDPTVWKDPEIIRPERFLNIDNQVINRAKLISFGLGKRSCSGEILGRQSVFLFLTSLLQRFDIRPPEGQKSINVREVTALTTTPSHFEVRMVPRVKKI